jgi:hypothetical protein
VKHAANVNITKPSGDCLLHYFIGKNDVFGALFLVKVHFCFFILCLISCETYRTAPMYMWSILQSGLRCTLLQQTFVAVFFLVFA